MIDLKQIQQLRLFPGLTTFQEQSNGIYGPTFSDEKNLLNFVPTLKLGEK